MTHPEELLASYVDATASTEERAVVDAHVASCARCRGEILAATAARAALKRLPVLDAPAGLAPDLEVRVPARTPGGGGVPAWYRWAGGAAVAAVIVLLLAMVLPHLGGSTSDTKQTGALGGGSALTDASGVPLESQAQDYAGSALTQLLQAQAAATHTPEAATAPPSAEGGIQAGVDTQAADAQAKNAEACIKHAFKKVPGTLIRLISARYAGAPAYIGIYEQGPRGQPADTVVARVAAADTCTILTIGQARLTP